MSALPLARIFRGTLAGPGMARRITALIGLRRSRQRLGLLDDHLLADIGLTRTEALAEASLPPWDAPSHWQG
jgi:uncharacterized protein YjiS (DUF1127 family)